MKKLIYLFVIALLLSCNTEKPTAFSENILQEKFLTTNDKAITFKEIRQNIKEKK
ncbi:hypothetical protein PJW08_11895 [Tenacibaculum finnmarkense]|nr:hypothetical protein PJW08_11895 [Tenacibaculum finnmarkense]